MEQVLVRIFLILALLLSGPSDSFAATTIYNLALPNDDGDGDSNNNQGLVFAAGTLSACAGCNQIRVTFLFGSASPVSAGAVTSIWVGRGAGSGSYDYNGNQCQLLTGGSASFSGGPNVSVVTDFCTFAAGETFDNTKDLVVRFHFLNGTSASIAFTSSAPGVSFGFTVGADNSGATVSGITTFAGTTNSGITKIEAQVSGGGATSTRRTLTGVGN